jgi:cation:H+ antiporter
MLEIIIVFILALIVLVKASEYIIDASIEISKILKISQFAVGFILLSVSTSIPELFVSSIASFEGNSGIAVGNVIGSNIANITFVLGITAMLGVIMFRKKSATENAGALFIISMIPLLLIWRGDINQFNGLILVVIFIFYCYFVAKRGHTPEITDHRHNIRKVAKTYGKFFGSLVLVMLSAYFVVQSGSAIAEEFQLSHEFIGLGMIALGTSLPELIVNVTAMRKKKTSLAVGNILGSCVTNLTLVLGVAAVISPMQLGSLAFSSAIMFLMVANLFLWFQISLGKISKTSGVVMVLAYLFFILVEAGLVII